MIRPPEPWSRMTRAAAWHRKKLAFKLTSCWMSQSASLTSNTLGRRRSTAAVCTSTSSFPKALVTFSTSAA